MKIVVTGASGFIGGPLVELCRQAGHEVAAFDRSHLADAGGAATSAREETLRQLRGAEAIIHLAGLYPRFDRSAPSPHQLFLANTWLCAHLLDAAAQADVPRFIQTSTANVYGAATPAPQRERPDPGGTSPYAVSKIAAETLLRQRRHTTGLRATSLRLFNIYGPGQPDSGVVATICRQAAAHRDIEIHDDAPVCDFVFVRDAAAALLAAATASRDLPDTINIGTGRGTAIGELCRLAMRQAGYDGVLRVRHPSTAGRASVSIADTALAARSLDWQPATRLERGIAATLAVYRTDTRGVPTP